jgi:hypothetical protein
MTGRDGIARAIYVTATGRRVVVVRAFIKKTERTPRAEIELAYKRAGLILWRRCGSTSFTKSGKRILIIGANTTRWKTNLLRPRSNPFALILMMKSYQSPPQVQSTSIVYERSLELKIDTNNN